MSPQEHADRLRPTGGLPFEFVASKLRRPLVRPGTVRRSLLIERLARGDPAPVVCVVAPAGYGKTTLLSQWAERSDQAFAWVLLDERDNDPMVLLAYVAEALKAVEPVSQRVSHALASQGSSGPGPAVATLAFAFSSMTSPVVLVLDDLHVLHEGVCWEALSVLADHVPDGSRLVLAGRDPLSLTRRIAHLRAPGRILEIGPRDLVLCQEEASSLLRNTGVPVGEQEVAELHRRTEGWPAGLYLAALSLREGGPVATMADSFDGDDQLVSEYLESEFLARFTPRQRKFLTRTSVLERMCGPLCEAVLDCPSAAATLAYLTLSSQLLVPLDGPGKWYRYHRLLRDVLLSELRRTEPDLIPVLRRRAASWCLRNSLPEEALEYYMAADDIDAAAGLIAEFGMRAFRQGRVATVQRWLGWLEDRGRKEGHPMEAVMAGLLSAVTGRAAEAERWAEMADRWQYGEESKPEDPATEAWVALLRAFLCPHGVKQMTADADDAARRFAAEGILEPAAALMQGVARVLSGDLDGGDRFLAEAASVAEASGAPDVAAVAWCERALVATARGDSGRAKAMAGRAPSLVRRAGIEESYAAPLACAVHARTALPLGDIPTARRELVSAQRARHELTYALPHLAVQARVELARAHLALEDPAGARTLMRETDELLRCHPDLGNLASEAETIQARVSEEHGPSIPGASALTAAELRLLPTLASQLSFPEIGSELFLSRHTIKSQAVSIYRKLGVSSRAQAVARARQIGLLPG